MARRMLPLRRMSLPAARGLLATAVTFVTLLTACSRSQPARYPTGETLQEATLYNEMQLSTALAGMEGAAQTLAAMEQAQVRISKVVAQALCMSAVLWMESHHACPTLQEVVEQHMVSDDLSPKDAWENPYRISCNAESSELPVVTSAGPDGVFGTADDVTSRLEGSLADTAGTSDPSGRKSGPWVGDTPTLPEEAGGESCPKIAESKPACPST
jgi:hypothetical protein